MNNRKLLLVGGGGHCKSVIDVLDEDNHYEEIGIVDLPEQLGKRVLGHQVVGDDSDFASLYKEGYCDAFISLGSVGDPTKRIGLYQKLKSIGFNLPNIISKSVVLSKYITIGEGNFIGKGVVVNADTVLGNNLIINSGAIVEHECQIGDFVHLAPGSVLSANVIVGYGSHVGTSATIIQGKTIGDNTIIGAGSVVVSSIGSNKIAYGCPCKEMKSK